MCLPFSLPCNVPLLPWTRRPIFPMQWQMHQRQTRIETVLETQRGELYFIKRIIEKLLPPKGVL